MRQFDLASVVAFASHGDGSRVRAPIGSRLLAGSIGAPEMAALTAFLPDFKIDRLRGASADGLSGIVAWSGSRHQGREERRAAALGVPFLLLGWGLLRAAPWSGRATPPLSATAHTMTGPSSPVDILAPGRLLATRGWESSALLARAADARRAIVSRRLGGSWWNTGADPGLPPGGGFVLIVGGEEGRFGANGSPSPALLRAMLMAALAERAPHQIVVLAPDHGGRLGLPPSFLSDAASRGCSVPTRAVDRWEVIERADFAGACLIATRYVDPFRNEPATFENALEILREWRKAEAANRRMAVCVGMSFWKRRQVAAFLRSNAGTPAFRRTTRAALATARTRSGGAIAVWASRAPAGLVEAAGRHGIPLIRVEDGFVRSVGLGSDFMPAASLVLDSRGMHFDPSVRSDLEQLLLDADFDAALIERARSLIAQLVARGVTKYNLGKRVLAIRWPTGRRRILVPGQVEDDLSVRLGGEGVSGNLDLLGRVRAANPDAFILYKPHPDVEAGHRKGRIPDEVAGNFADAIIRQVSTAAVLTEIDELHTLTSLAGFEALLRRRRVVVYGRPFYAGWGLTTDLAVIDRGRRLTLAELVAGALILYPRYLDPVTRLPCGPEIVIERLDDPGLWKPGPLVVARRLQGVLARCWSNLAGRTGKFAAGPIPPSGRDDFRTPLL